MTRAAAPAAGLHVYLDESGGADAANDIFLAAAVAVAPHDAARLLRSYRKATRTTGEVHGHQLDRRQRGIFLDLLAREAASVVVVCQRRERLGGWVMSELPEVDLYGHLLGEACAALSGFGGAGPLTAILDRPRYAAVYLRAIRARLTATLAPRHGGRVTVAIGDSRADPGLQATDVVANSVFQMLGGTGTTGDLLQPLLAAGRLAIAPLRMTATRPGWIERP